jgi:hypothetical protein
MQMTQAIRDLLRAHREDQEFPYMDFIGAFLLVERWIQRTGGSGLLDRLNNADAAELLGLPLGTTIDDIKLGYVMGLIRDHGVEVLESISDRGLAMCN